MTTWLLVAGPPAATAQESADKPKTLPPGAKVLDRYVEVTGGPDAYGKIRTKVTVARYTPPSATGTAVQRSWFAGPKFFRQVTELPDGNIREEGVSPGDIAWYVSPAGGADLREGIARDRTMRHAFLHRDWKWRELFKSAETLKEETVNGEPCYVVLVTANNDDAETRYYSKKTGLLVAMDLGDIRKPQSMNIRTAYLDYRKAGDLLVPFKHVQSIAAYNIEVEYESIEFNKDIPHSRFEPPPGVGK